MLGAVSPALGWGAIAVSNLQASRFGYGFDHPTKESAEQRALAECGRGCKVVVTFPSGCGAYAYGNYKGERDYGIGRGPTRAKAEDDALDDCEFARWAECKIKVWACNGN